MAEAAECDFALILEGVQDCLKEGDVTPFVRDVAVLCNGTAFLVTDNISCTLTSYFVTEYGIANAFRVPVNACPFGITEVNPNLAALTMENVKIITLVDVKPELSENRLIEVQQFYLGIAKLDKEHLVLSYAGGDNHAIYIDIFDIQGEGKVLKTITTDLPHRMNYIAVTPSQDILVPFEVWGDTMCIMQATSESDNPNYEDFENGSALVCLDQDGNEKFRYPKERAPGFFQPRGVACNAEGYIFLSSMDGNIFMIKPDGSEGWVVESKDSGYRIATGLTVKDDKVCFGSSATIRIYNLRRQGRINLPEGVGHTVPEDHKKHKKHHTCSLS